jgi:hypothetical protein
VLIVLDGTFDALPTFRYLGVPHNQSDKDGNRQEQPPGRDPDLSEHQKAYDNGRDSGSQARIANPPELLLEFFGCQAAFRDTLLVLGEGIHNARLTAVMDDDEPIRIPVTDVFDLHTVAAREVKPVVQNYLEEAHRRGFRALRIIHGRGIGVQREIVRSILRKTPFVASFSDAPLEAGGWGATIVMLRQP